MDPDFDDGLADDLVLDVPTPHKTLSQRRPSPRNQQTGSRNDATDDEATWYSRFGAEDSDSVDDDHSHDLTYLAGRASVMDNMLLSLDQLEPSPSHSRNASFQQHDLPDFSLDSSGRPQRVKRATSSRRHNNHAQSSSYSSDYNLPCELPSSRRVHGGGGRARGESGSSSATFRAGLTREERELAGHGFGADGQRKRYPGDVGAALHSQHVRGARAKGSKNSNSSSVDMGYRGAALAPPPGLGTLTQSARRTASMDQLPYLDPSTGVIGAPSGNQRFNPAQSSNYDFLDAAPTPTVLQGPRKMSSTTNFGQASPVLSQAQLSPLLGSSRPNTSSRIHKAKPELPDASVFRVQANEFVDSATLHEKPLQGHSYGDFPAPSPNLSSSQKGWQSVSAAAAAATPAMPRERPGFFRRVFGSSKTSSPSVSAVPAGARQGLSSQGDSFIADALSQPQQQLQHNSSLGHHHIASQMRSHQPNANQRPSFSDYPVNDQEQVPFPPPATPSTPALTKKHSSFFRRRKKSVSDAFRGSPAANNSITPQQQLQQQHQHQQPLGNVDVNVARQHQSISSLRQVMNPYLGDSERADVYFDSSENQMRYPHVEKFREDNSSGIIPLPSHVVNPSATIRAVNSSGGRERTDWSLTYLGNEMAENIHAAGNMNIDSPKFKLKMRGRSNSSAVAATHDNTNDTFYAENSSAEASDHNILAYLDNRDDAGPLDALSKIRPMTSPTMPRPSQPRSIPMKTGRQRLDDQQQQQPGVSGDKFANSPSPQQEFHNATSWVTNSETSLLESSEPIGRRHSHHRPHHHHHHQQQQHHQNHHNHPVPPSSAPASAVPKVSRVWLHPDSSDEKLEEPNRAPPPPPPSVPPSLPYNKSSNAGTPKFSSSKSTPSSMHDAFQSATSLPALHPGAGEADGDDNDVHEGEKNDRPRSGDGLVVDLATAETKPLKEKKDTGLGIATRDGDGSADAYIDADVNANSVPKMSARLRSPTNDPDVLALAVAAAADAAAKPDLIVNANADTDADPNVQPAPDAEPASAYSYPSSPLLSSSVPSAEDRVIAQHIFDGTDEFANNPDRAMSILGETDASSARVRQAYMELFNWNGVNILMALRALCGNLLLRGESQQMDRVLDAFSERWCACNVNHGFKARGSYSDHVYLFWNFQTCFGWEMMANNN